MLTDCADNGGGEVQKREVAYVKLEDYLNHHGMNISLWVKVGVEVGVVKEELGGGNLVEGAM